MTLFDLPVQPLPPPTTRAQQHLEAGRHPANGQPLHDDPARTCRTCIYHRPVKRTRTYHKCENHRLGITRSAASDIRVTWPACNLHHPATDTIACPDCGGDGRRLLTLEEAAMHRQQHRTPAPAYKACTSCNTRGRIPTPA